MNALQTAAIGRPSIISEEVIDRILKHLSKGNYIKPSVEASGISYQAFRAWMIRGEEHKARGVDSPYALLVDRVSHAQAQAEAALVGRLEGTEDWRAQAFILERRHRDRWGKDQAEQKASVSVQLPAELANVLIDVLRVAGATPIQGETIPTLPIKQVGDQEKPSESDADASQMLGKRER